MNATETWKRLTHPVTVEDWALTVRLDDLNETEEGRRILRKEILPYLPTLVGKAQAK